MQISISIEKIESITRIEGTAWDLVGQLYEYWYDQDYQIFVGGRASYSDAYNTKNEMICVWRLEALGDGLKLTKRYLHPDTPVYVQKIMKGSI